MARARLYIDAQKAYSGALSYLVPSAGGLVTIYDTDGATLLPYVMYDAASGGNVLSNPITLSNSGTKVVYCDVPVPCVFQPAGGAQVPGRFERASGDGARFYDITEYGAHPSFTASANTAAIRRAIAALDANGGGVLWIPPGAFKIVGALSDTEIFLLGTTQFQVRGAGRYSSFLVVQSGTPTTCDIFRWHITPTLPGCAFYDFTVMSADSLGGSNTYGRHTVNFDITESDREVRAVEIAGVWLDHFGSASGGRCIELTNPTSHVNSMYLVTIRDSYINGGIRMLNCGDTISLERLAIFGPNVGVEATQVVSAGATSLRLIGLNVTSTGGGIWLKGAINPEIRGGIYELSPSAASYGDTSGNGAYIDLDGTSGTQITGGTIRDLTVAIPNHAHAADCIRLNYAVNTDVDGITFNTATGRKAINITANATAPRIGDRNIDLGAGTMIPGAGFFPRSTTSIASASTIVLPPGGGHQFSVSGTTQINNITARGDGDWAILYPLAGWNFGSGGNIQPKNTSAMAVVAPVWMVWNAGLTKWFELAGR